MVVREVTDPELIEFGRRIGFKGKILVEDSQPGILQFISDKCYWCDKPWTVQAFGQRTEEELQKDPSVSDELGSFNLCDDHHEEAKKKWVRPMRIVYRRDLTQMAILKKIWKDGGRYRAIIDLGDRTIEMVQMRKEK